MAEDAPEEPTMTPETPTTGERKTWKYPAAEFAKMYAPMEKIQPAVKLRALLRTKFMARRANPVRCFLHTAGAGDAMTAALLTDLGFEAVYASGSQLAVARNLYPDLGIYPSHQMPELVRELQRGIEGARDRWFFDSKGEVKNTPPIFADIDAGAGGPTQAFALTRELIRAGAAGVLVEDRIEKLVAVKAAAEAAESALVVIARSDARSLDRALEAASLGVDLIWPEFGETDLDGPQRFAESVHKHYPDQLLGLNLSPSLHWGKAKREGRLPTNRQLGQLGYTLQSSSLLAFRAAGMALEAWLTGFQRRGLDALADLQLVETASLEGEPRTRMHQRFAGTDRWLSLEARAKEA
jgi:isocitrate lyase